MDDVYGDQTNRYLTALERCVPEVPADVRVLRFAFAKDFLNRALAHRDRGMILWIDEHVPRTVPGFTEHVIDFRDGAFEAPVTVEP
jgi:hypothetical protein